MAGSTVKGKTFEVGPGLTCDVERLIYTRLLVTANSGGGKSYLLRRLLEQTHGHVQQIVIDPEGEFASLREKFDYVLAAKSGGETIADPRAAALLAERLLELKVSAILDIYELKQQERREFVKLFLSAMVDSPKKLWHPVLITLDEAHVFCPEDGDAQSSDAVKAACSLGRKRGFCMVLATQRLAKLSKDAAAECTNKLVGRTTLDVDLKRAALELGFSRSEFMALRDLDDGEFFAWGPALSRIVTRVKVGAITTTHPTAGGHQSFTAPPPTSKIRALLPKLKDLPAEAEERNSSIDSLRKSARHFEEQFRVATARVRLLEDRLDAKAKEKQQGPEKEVKVPFVSAKTLKSLRETQRHFKRAQTGIETAFGESMKRITDAAALVAKDIAPVVERLSNEISKAERIALPVGGFRPPNVTPEAARAIREAFKNPVPAGTLTNAKVSFATPPENGNGLESGGRRRILQALAQFGPSRPGRVRALARIKSPESLRVYLGQLKKKRYVEETQGGEYLITQGGSRALGSFQLLPTGTELADYWKQELGSGGRGKLFATLLEARGEWLDNETMLKRAGINSPESLRVYLGQLRVLELVETATKDGRAKIAEAFESI